MNSAAFGRGWRRACGCVVLSFGVSRPTALPAQVPAPSPAQSSAASPTQLAEAVRAWMTDYAALGDPNPTEALDEFRPGLFEQFQFRSESDRLDLGRQRYAVRFQPKLPHVRRAERDLQQAERAALAEVARPAALDADEDALRLLFGLAADAAELRTVDSLIALQRTLVEVTFRRVTEPGYDVDRVLDAQDDLADLRLVRERLERRVTRRPAPLPLDRLVGVPEVAERLERLRAAGPAALPPSARLAILDAELALERAENQTWLDFLQVNYRSDLEETRRRYSIGGGVELPRRASALTAVDKLRVERQEEEMKLRIERSVAERELAEATDALALRLEQYSDLHRSLEERRRNRLPLERLLASAPEAQPEDVLRLRRRNLSDRLKLLDLAADIREDYARLLTDHFVLDVETIAAYVLGD